MSLHTGCLAALLLRLSVFWKWVLKAGILWSVLPLASGPHILRANISQGLPRCSANLEAWVQKPCSQRQPSAFSSSVCSLICAGTRKNFPRWSLPPKIKFPGERWGHQVSSTFSPGGQHGNRKRKQALVRAQTAVRLGGTLLHLPCCSS